MNIRTTLVAVAAFFGPSATGAAPPLVEVTVDRQASQGRVFAQGGAYFWLLSQDGRLRPFSTEKVEKFRQVSPQFQTWSSGVIKDQLRRELGRSFAVASTRHYIVCAPGEQKARAYAEVFEEIFRTFQLHFSVRGFKVPEPEFPMVAIVFADFESFRRYAAAEKVPASAKLRGYYLTTSNRVALYERDDDSVAGGHIQSPLKEGDWLRATANRESETAFARCLSPFFQLPGALHLQQAFYGDVTGQGHSPGRLEGALRDTMVHEATHQAAFNTGLHSRIGDNPKWIVEGLATVFEAPGIRNSGANKSIKSRINPARFTWFGNYQKSRRKAGSLAAFVSNDTSFDADPLDAYSEAWALTFFLVETRPRAYCELLKTIAGRDPLLQYPGAERLADFERTIGRDVKLIEAEYLRFLAGIH